MAWPMGVVVPYARHMSHGLREWALKRVMEAMREPRARPSKVSMVAVSIEYLPQDSAT